MEVDNNTMLLGPQGVRPLHLHAPVLPRKGDMMALCRIKLCLEESATSKPGGGPPNHTYI